MTEVQTEPGVATATEVALRAGAETPAYVYDLAEVRSNTERLRAALPEHAELYYSLKANPHPAVLAELRSLGVRPEVCSPGELHAALDAGWSGAEVFYTGPGKRDRDVQRALALGVREFCVDSPTGLDQLDRLAERADVHVRCLIRVNDDQPVSGQGLAMTGVASQFGADVAWILAEPARFVDRARVRVVGLHLYMGTNMTEVGALLAQFTQSLASALRIAGLLSGHGVVLEEINLGGGFGAPFAKEGPPVDLAGLRDGLTELIDQRLPGRRDGSPRLAFESGRYLVGTAGSLVTAVLDVKRSHGRDVVVLESGINHLGGMAGLRRLPPLNPSLLGPARAGENRSTMVTGPLCTPLDTWSRTASLPPLRVGDLVTVPNVGAYGLSASLLAFLGHPAPLEVAVDGDHVVHVSRLTISRKD
jgi:diaminopimelate decarboxylase